MAEQVDMAEVIRMFFGYQAWCRGQGLPSPSQEDFAAGFRAARGDTAQTCSHLSLRRSDVFQGGPMWVCNDCHGIVASGEPFSVPRGAFLDEDQRRTRRALLGALVKARHTVLESDDNDLIDALDERIRVLIAQSFIARLGGQR